MEVAIVGAGIIGLAIARELAQRGIRVVVFDRDEPGKQSSWAAAGMLAPQTEADGPGPFVSLLLRAREQYPALVRALEEETGLDPGYRTEGMLALALSDADEEALASRYAWQSAAGLRVERLSRSEVLSLEPSVTSAVRGALHFPGDHQVENRLLTRAYWMSAVMAGAEFRVGEGIRGFRWAEGRVRLDLDRGGVHETDRVVLAAGSWSGAMSGLPRQLPVEPVHGQLIAIETGPPLLRHTLAADHGYLVPRSDGRLIAGTTVERIGFRSRQDVAGLHHITGAVLRMAPGLAARPVVARWSGLRPGTPDGLPILGPDPSRPELLYATGHYRNGILLAPVTASIIGSLLAGEEPEFDLHPFSPDRF